MKKILIPTDFSYTAANAVDFAVQASKNFPAKLILMHSYEISSSFTSDFYGANKEFNLIQLNDLEKRLDLLKENIKKEYGVNVETSLSTYPLDEAIKKVVEEKEIDLVVMGTVGASGLKEKIWGSRTSSVIGHLDVPVMIIPDDYKWIKPDKVLFLTSKFEKSSRILDFIFEMAGILMTNVYAGVFTDTDDDKSEVFLDHKVKLAEYEDYLKSNYNEPSLKSVHLAGTEFDETLQRFCDTMEIDMLVMVTYPRGFWTNIFNPSLTKKMSYHTKLPLLAIPASMM